MELSKSDMSLLTDLLKKNTLEEDNCSEEIASCGDFGLTFGELHCLASLTPISLKVINIVAAYLSATESESWYLPTFFGDIARSSESLSEVKGWVGSAIKTCRLQRFHRRLQQCSKIFIPLHDHMSDHWYLLVLNLVERNGEILDNMPDVHCQERRMAHAREAVVISEHNPMHINEAESGIYAIRHMQYHGQNWYTKFDSLDHRCLIAIEIVRHPKNRVSHPNEAVVSHPRTSLKYSARNITNQVDGFSSRMAVNGRKWRSHRLRRSRA